MDVSIETIRDAQDQDPAWKVIKDDLKRPEEKRKFHFTRERYLKHGVMNHVR